MTKRGDFISQISVLLNVTENGFFGLGIEGIQIKDEKSLMRIIEPTVLINVCVKKECHNCYLRI